MGFGAVAPEFIVTGQMIEGSAHRRPAFPRLATLFAAPFSRRNRAARAISPGKRGAITPERENAGPMKGRRSHHTTHQGSVDADDLAAQLAQRIGPTEVSRIAVGVHRSIGTNEVIPFTAEGKCNARGRCVL